MSSHIDVSYFAAGIVSHLSSDGEEEWNLQTIGFREILKDLVGMIHVLYQNIYKNNKVVKILPL